MDPTPEGTIHACALVVAPEGADRALLVEALQALGVRVDVADDFHQGKGRLAVLAPDVLVTELRLAAYNGLHLVLHARSLRPTTRAIVLTRAADPVLQREAAQLDADLLVKEADPGWIAAVVAAVSPLLACGDLPAKPAEGA